VVAFVLLCLRLHTSSFTHTFQHPSSLTNTPQTTNNQNKRSIGTAEVESALVAHPKCAEAAVVGYDHPIKGQGIYAYVTLMEGEAYTEELRRELVAAVRNTIGAFAAPDVVHW
jgi:acetyl-CoA synthetase